MSVPAEGRALPARKGRALTARARRGAILSDIAIASGSDFIGRANELRRLQDLLDRARGGRCAVALVSGDAGVGKTRLLRELATGAERDDVRVLVGACVETGDVGLPYVPFVDAFADIGARSGEAELVGTLAGAVANLRRLLPAVEGDGSARPMSAGEFEQVELFGGIHTLLVRLSDLAPLLVVIEDLHWADRSTRDLLAFLVRSLRGGRVALVASYRSDELHRRHPLRPLLAELVRVPAIERIDLPPFTRAELADHLEGLVGERVDAAVVDRILARSEGNAFFSEELVAAGAISSDVILPDALADVLRARIEDLPDSAQEVVKVASVAGRRVPHRLLIAAVGRPEPETEPGLREAIARQVLVADPRSETYGFRHALLQEAAYGDLLPGERTRLHATYARLLAESGPAAELAHHYLASHDLPAALDALVRAAGEASAVSAPAEAFRHLTQAIELWERVPDAAEITQIDRASLLLGAADAAGNSGEFRSAAALARTAVSLTDSQKDALLTARAHERLGEHLYQSGALDDDTLATFRRAVDLVPPEPPSALRARVTAGLARALMAMRRYDEARKWCDEALETAKKVGAVEDETHALITLALLEVRHDRAAAARRLLHDARRRAALIEARVQELRAVESLGSLELDVGDLPSACRALDDAVALAESTGLTWSQYGINSGALRSFAYYAAGRWDEAEALAVAPDERMSAGARLSAAALFVEVGRGRTRAAERLARLESLWSGDDWIAYLAGGCGTDLALWQEDFETAMARAERTLSVLDAADETWELSAIWPATLALAAQAEQAERARVARDDDAVAAARAAATLLIERCREAARRTRSFGRQIGPEAVAWLARAEAEWTRLEGQTDPECWTAAAEAFAYGYVYEEGRARWRLAEALLTVGRRDEATEQARAAHATALRLGARPLRRAVESLARRGRLDVAEDGPRAVAGGLTPREAEVVRLVAEGRSNQEIADALYISRKTASVHVSHILAKLGARTRVEAAAIAHRLGLDEPHPEPAHSPERDAT